MNSLQLKTIPVYVFIISLLFQTSVITQSDATEKEQFKEAQAIVTAIVRKHPQIIRLTIHAVPTGETQSRIIACNIKKKIGKLSDPEDLEAMKSNKITVLEEGDNLDVTAPILNSAGKPIAATGITLRYAKGDTEEKLTEKAKLIARELSNAIQDATKPLW